MINATQCSEVSNLLLLYTVGTNLANSYLYKGEILHTIELYNHFTIYIEMCLYCKLCRTHRQNSEWVLLHIKGLEYIGQLAGISVKQVHTLGQVVRQFVEIALSRQRLYVKDKLLHRGIWNGTLEINEGPLKQEKKSQAKILPGHKIWQNKVIIGSFLREEIHTQKPQPHLEYLVMQKWRFYPRLVKKLTLIWTSCKKFTASLKTLLFSVNQCDKIAGLKFGPTEVWNQSAEYVQFVSVKMWWN